LTRLPLSVHSSAKNGRFLPLLSFQHVYTRSPPRLPTITRSRGFSFFAACFLQVRLREPVNRPFFALLPRSSLIPHALTPVNRKFACSSLLGVKCPYFHPVRARFWRARLYTPAPPRLSRRATPQNPPRGLLPRHPSVAESPHCQLRIGRGFHPAIRTASGSEPGPNGGRNLPRERDAKWTAKPESITGELPRRGAFL
jgi:hypothetical protein